MVCETCISDFKTSSIEFYNNIYNTKIINLPENIIDYIIEFAFPNKHDICYTVKTRLNYDDDPELYMEEAGYLYDWKRHTVCSRCYYNGISKCLFQTDKPPHLRIQISWFKTLFDDNETYEQTKQLLNNYDVSDHYFIEYNDFTQCLKKF